MLQSSEACERNKDPLLNVLRSAFARRGRVLEIGSGTGQHAVYFAAQLPHLLWYPTDQLARLPALTARIDAEGGSNLRRPATLDVHQAVWPVQSVDAVFTANTLHIMGWDGVTALFDGVDRVLAAHGSLAVYGPFRYGNRYTSESNQAFDRMLRSRDPQSGLRHVEQVTTLAAGIGLALMEDHDLPAFNRLLVFER